jgi:hypothetical protein
VNPGDLILSWFPGWSHYEIFITLMIVLAVFLIIMITLNVQAFIEHRNLVKAHEETSAMLATATAEIAAIYAPASDPGYLPPEGPTA